MRRRLGYYILDEQHNIVYLGPLGAHNMDVTLRWARFLESKDRIVAQTYVGVARDWWVSTVFLGLDHSFDMGGPPLFFETMVFWQGKAPIRSEWIDYQDRYSTWDEAMAGHERVCHELGVVVSDTDAAEAEAQARLERRKA